MTAAQETEVITITPKALDEIKRIFREQSENAKKGLRVGVVGGGCSGLSYKIDFDDPREKDHVLRFDENLEVYIDVKSAIYLKGVELDFQDGLKGKGFVFQNPNATNTCGCGESFSI